MMTEAEALREAREHLVAGIGLTPLARPRGPMYLTEDPAELFFFRVDRGELRAGADEIVGVRKRDGTVAYHGQVGE